jgi:glutathione peroxidase-family protein
LTPLLHQQEPGANATEVYNSLANVRPGGGFVPAFPLFKKIDVNGPLAADWYKFLKVTTFRPLYYQYIIIINILKANEFDSISL